MVASSAAELSEYLDKLSDCEVAMAEAEKKCEIFHAQQTQSIFSSRREITKHIPQFWYIVLSQCEDFAEFVRPEDLKYMESISDIYVHRHVVDSDTIKHYRDFSITIEFQEEPKDTKNENSKGMISLQKVTKFFSYIKVEGKETMVSDAVAFIWPEELRDICPSLIRENKRICDFSPDEKKKYRQGMRSFFAWFEWNGRKPGKEFRGGEDLTHLIVDEIFPEAVNLYVEAMNSANDSELDSSEGEELDVSDDEDEEEEEEVQPETKKQKV